jgi:[protein-PII] uridylyltransferase
MRPINERFLDRAGMLEVARDDLYLENPHAILETFLSTSRRPAQGLSARTLRALYNARNADGRASFRRDPVNRELFMDILRQPSGRRTPSG